MKKKLCLLQRLSLVVFTASIFSFFLIKNAFAVTVTISDIPATITTDPFTLTASVSGAQAGTNYVKIDLFKDGTQNYFGETNTPQGWYGGTDYTQTYPITIVSNTPWSGQIQGKLGTPTLTQYDGTGTYKLRVRRFTSGGSYIASDAVSVSIAVPTQTPTPTITPTPTDVPTPTRTPTPIKTPTPNPTDKDEPTPSPTSNKKLSPTQVLGDSTQSATVSDNSNTKEQLSPIPETKVAGIQTQQDVTPLFFVGGGVLLLLACGILKFRPQLQQLWQRL